MRTQTRKGFTLVELLVVIAVIALLAAILFPVFAKAREKGRQTVCLSNTKQFALAILQYAGDYDEAMPLAYKDDHSFGSGTAANNAGSPAVGGVQYGQTGIPAEVQPYIKNTDVFNCPDDHAIILDEATNTIKASSLPGAGSNQPMGTTATSTTQATGLTYFQVYGTSYKFTAANFSNPVGTASKNLTGYVAPPVCSSLKLTSCDFVAHGETFILGSGKTYPYQPGENPGGGYGYDLVTLGQFTRPSETREMADWSKPSVITGSNNGDTYAFHKNGISMAYVDGHAKFIVTQAAYQSGCDGIDWAWDNAGSCNARGLQRDAN